MSNSTFNNILLASSVQTISGTAEGVVNNSHSALLLVIDVTAASGTVPSMIVKIQGYDRAADKWLDVLGAVTAAIIGVSTTQLYIIPAAAPITNIISQVFLPPRWRAVWTITGTTPSFTMSLGAQTMLP